MVGFILKTTNTLKTDIGDITLVAVFSHLQARIIENQGQNILKLPI